MKILFNIIILFVSIVSIGCGDSVSAKELLISRDQEVQMGEEFDKKLRAGELKDQIKGNIWVASTDAEKEFEAYYDSIAYLLVDQISKSDADLLLPSGTSLDEYFHFAIVESDDVNAFAVMGGYVYFYTGIFKQFSNESEFVSVMGHEITHIVKHHSRDAQIKALGWNTALSIVLGEESITADIATSLLGLKYSKDNEYEADEGGMTLSAEANINPTGITSFFGKNIKIDNSGNCENSTIENIFGLFSTHPLDCDRVKAADNFLDDLAPKYLELPLNTTKYRNLVDAAF